MESHSMRYLLDTHTWIWWNARPQALSKQVSSIIINLDYEELLLSAISVWEFSKLLEKGRLTLSCDGLIWIQEALDMPRLKVVPLTPEISFHSTQLPQPFHDDPADQIIVATARIENATILTCDRSIRSYRHTRSLW